jgi:hypothetical protein
MASRQTVVDTENWRNETTLNKGNNKITELWTIVLYLFLRFMASLIFSHIRISMWYIQKNKNSAILYKWAISNKLNKQNIISNL